MSMMMENILFATDLDGTLLNSAQQLYDYDIEKLNKMIQAGVKFTISTARSPASSAPCISGVDLKIPAVCLNGALLWDFSKDEAVQAYKISEKTVLETENLLKEHALSALAFEKPSGGSMRIFYQDGISKSQIDYMRGRDFGGKRQYIKIDHSFTNYEIIYFAMHDNIEKLTPVYNNILKIFGLSAVFYSDIYHLGTNFLECYSSKTGKGQGVINVKEITGAKKIYVFGDNFNDLAMFEIADKSFATANAGETIRLSADEIILSNIESGVVKKISEICGMGN